MEKEEGEIRDNFQKSYSRDKKSKKDKKKKKSSRSRSRDPKRTRSSKTPEKYKRRSPSPYNDRDRSKKYYTRNSRSRSPRRLSPYRKRSISPRGGRYSPSHRRNSSVSRSINKKHSRSPHKKKDKKEKKDKKDRSDKEKSGKDKKSKKDKKERKSKDRDRDEKRRKKVSSQVVTGAFAEDSEQQQHDEDDPAMDQEQQEGLMDIMMNGGEENEDDQRARQRAKLLSQFKATEVQPENNEENGEDENAEESESDSIVIKTGDKSKIEMLKLLENERNEIDIKRKNSQQFNHDEEEPEEEVEDESDMFDMNDSDIEKQDDEKKKKAAVYDQYDVDDANQYLKIRIGEVIGERYKVINKLGEGVFASVCSAEDLKATNESEKIVAIKILRAQEIMLASGEKEAAVLRTLNSTDKFDKKHIVKLLRSFDHHKHLCLVFELLDMNLRDTIKHYGKMQLDHIRSYGMQLFKALTHMKKNKIIHSDIKPDNIVISKDTKIVKICDFGTAFPIEERELVQYMVSRFYRAPEIIIGYNYDYGIDTWSIACTLYEMYTGEFMFTGRNNNELLKDQQMKRGKIKTRLLKKGIFVEKFFDQNNFFLSAEIDNVSNKSYIKTINFGDQPQKDFLIPPKSLLTEEKRKFALFKDLLEKCTNMDPKLRLQPEKALEHPFFQVQPVKK